MKTANVKTAKWTQFRDAHSGGGLKEKWAAIFIEAPEEEARVIFYNRFGHNPDRVTCTCCGPDYSIDEDEDGDLDQLTAYRRGCKFVEDSHDNGSDGQYVEEPRGDSTPYMTPEQYAHKSDVLFIPAAEIKDKERIGDVPEQGYVWKD
jgi:hypothetical protein